MEKHSSRATGFPLVFNKKYSSSTYTDNIQVWEGTPEPVKTKLEKLGRSKGGEWAALKKSYNKQQ